MDATARRGRVAAGGLQPAGHSSTPIATGLKPSTTGAKEHKPDLAALARLVPHPRACGDVQTLAASLSKARAEFV
jgi:hypothetical protein